MFFVTALGKHLGRQRVLIESKEKTTHDGQEKIQHKNNVPQMSAQLSIFHGSQQEMELRTVAGPNESKGRAHCLYLFQFGLGKDFCVGVITMANWSEESVEEFRLLPNVFQKLFVWME